MTRVGGIVLCGGKSSRMGSPKALLPFGPELMIERVVRLLGEVVSPIVLVAAEDQQLPELATPVLVACDAHPDRGPLEGMLAGLKAIAPHADAAYITSCDVPLLEAAFVRYLIDQLGENQAAVPMQGALQHPLSAVYRTSVIAVIEQLLASDQRRPVFVFDHVATAKVATEDLEDVDPTLNTLKNCNFPADYLAALTLAGFDPPLELLESLSRRGSDGNRD